MANVVNGKVDSSSNRMVPTKTGRMTKVYDLYVDGVKYGFGFKDPTTMGIVPGTVLAFEYDPSRYNSINMGSLVIGAGAGGPVSGGGSPVSATSVGGSSGPTGAPPFRGKMDRPFPVPVTSGEYAIIRQNALTNARELVAAMETKSDGIPPLLGDDAGWNAVVNRVLKVAYVFEDYSSGQREVKEAMKLRTTDKINKAMDTINGVDDAT